MTLADSLLSAIVRADGDALVMHVGERPYVVVGANTVNISAQGLHLDAMTQMLAQLLPADSQAQLEEFGAVEHRLPDIDNDRFNVVAARGGDDIWIEIRRRRNHSADASVNAADLHKRPASATVAVAEREAPVETLADTSTAIADEPGMQAASAPAEETIGERRHDEPVVAVEPAGAVASGLPAEPLPAADRMDAAAGAGGIRESETAAPLPLPVLDEPHVESEAESVIEWAAAAESAAADGAQDVDFVPWSLPEDPAAAHTEAAVEAASTPEPIAEPPPPAVAEVRAVPTPEPVGATAPIAEPIQQPVEEPVASTQHEPMAEAASKPPTPVESIPQLESIALVEPASPEEPVASEEAVAPVEPVPAAEPVTAAEPGESVEPTEPAERVDSVPVTRTVRIEVPPRMPVVSHSTDVERLVRLAASRGASALLLQTDSRPYLRVEGDVRPLDGEPVLTRSAVELAIAEISPGTGHDAAGKVEPGEWLKEYADLGRVRCSSFNDHRGPGLMLRLVASRAATAEQLGLSSEVCALATESQGLVIVAGPRASGKTTLLSALVDLVNGHRAEYVITLERQIELVHDNKKALISQREVRGSEGEALSAAHAALRERPDVLAIDDLISPHMVPLVLTAASEGVLVFVSVAAPSTTEAVQRFVELASPEMRPAVQNAMAESFRGAVAQTRLKKSGGGLVTAREVLLATAPVSRLVAEGQLAQLPHALDAGRKYGMVTFEETFVEHVRTGLVDVREAFRKAPDRDRLLTGLRREGVDTRLVERLV